MVRWQYGFRTAEPEGLGHVIASVLGIGMLADLAADAASRIIQEFFGILGICGVVYGFGGLLTLLGAFADSGTGKKLIVHGAVLNTIGLLGFYYVWSKPFSLIGLPVSFSYSLGVSISWSWSYGLYIAVVGTLVTMTSIVIGRRKREWEEPTSSLPEVPQRPQSKGSSWHEHQTPTAEEPHVASPWKRTDAMAHGAPSSPLLCSVGLHNWRYYGDPEQVVIRKRVRIPGREGSYATTGIKYTTTRRQCMRCGARQRAVISENADNTRSMDGWVPLTEGCRQCDRRFSCDEDKSGCQYEQD